MKIINQPKQEIDKKGLYRLNNGIVGRVYRDNKFPYARTTFAFEPIYIPTMILSLMDQADENAGTDVDDKYRVLKEEIKRRGTVLLCHRTKEDNPEVNSFHWEEIDLTTTYGGYFGTDFDFKEKIE
jgi:hypothetical protein